MSDSPGSLKLHHLIPVVKDSNWRTVWQGRLTTEEVLLLSHMESRPNLAQLQQLAGWPLPVVMQHVRQLIRYNLIELHRQDAASRGTPMPATPLTPPLKIVQQRQGPLPSAARANHIPNPGEMDATILVPKIRGGHPSQNWQSPSLSQSGGLGPAQNSHGNESPETKRAPLHHTLEPYPEDPAYQTPIHFVEVTADTQEDLPASPKAALPQTPLLSLQPSAQPSPDGAWSVPKQPGHLNFDPTVEEIPTIGSRFRAEVESQSSPGSFTVEDTPRRAIRALSNEPHASRASESDRFPAFEPDGFDPLAAEPTVTRKKTSRGKRVRVEKSSK